MNFCLNFQIRRVLSGLRNGCDLINSNNFIRAKKMILLRKSAAAERRTGFDEKDLVDQSAVVAVLPHQN